jgi:hypothetical protein
MVWYTIGTVRNHMGLKVGLKYNFPTYESIEGTFMCPNIFHALIRIYPHSVRIYPHPSASFADIRIRSASNPLWLDRPRRQSDANDNGEHRRTKHVQLLQLPHRLRKRAPSTKSTHLFSAEWNKIALRAHLSRGR